MFLKFPKVDFPNSCNARSEEVIVSLRLFNCLSYTDDVGILKFQPRSRFPSSLICRESRLSYAEQQSSLSLNNQLVDASCLFER